MSYYTLLNRDVGRRYLRLYNRVYNLASSVGVVLKSDVGKRIYINSGYLQMENDEQYKERISKNERNRKVSGL